MPPESRAVDRRGFLAGAAVLSTYSLFVHGPGVPEAEAEERTPDEIRRSFGPLEATAVRIHVAATDGSENASVYEVRCYSGS